MCISCDENRKTAHDNSQLIHNNKSGDYTESGRFAYKLFRLHWIRFAYTIWDVSPTLKSIRLQPNTEE